jgi:NAD(P)-dependent dehydrogenase (short-subunit alcohol dehydrogenase family)
MYVFSGGERSLADQGRERPKCEEAFLLLAHTAIQATDARYSRSFSDFALHLHTNTIGPIICARKLLELQPESPPSKVIFISSDSGSALAFRDHEDGFGAYAASKAALNQMLRHMAVEVKKRGDKWDDVCVLALHPGEVQTWVTKRAIGADVLTTRRDMANINLDWEVEGIIQADESVKGMLQVIESKGKDDTGTFWCWDGKVS